MPNNLDSAEHCISRPALGSYKLHTPSSTRPFAGIYSRRKVFITGHTGFKGGWLALWLKLLEAEVFGYSLDPPTVPSFFEAVGLESLIDYHVIGDVRDGEKLAAAMQEFRPEFVFHLAAQPLVRISYQDPRLTYETNVMGTINVLEAVRQVDTVRAAIMVTSDKCYENREWPYGYREIDPMGGYDPYSSSKGCAELVIAAYIRSFFNPQEYGRSHQVALASVRAGNVIGGGDWGQDRLVPDCVRALSGSGTIYIRNPSAIRPWQHVLEPLGGYLLLGAKLWTDGSQYTGAWNFGPPDEEVLTVEEIVKEVIRLWGEGRYQVDSNEHPHEAHWLKLDCSKARIKLGWRSKLTVRQALAKTVEWYKRFYEGAGLEEMQIFTQKQIEEYMGICSDILEN